MFGLSSDLRLRIRFHRLSDLITLLSLAILVMGFLSYLIWEYQDAAASTPKSPQTASLGLRNYYLTTDVFQGNQAKTACAAGYHMASLWEIVNPSNLKYNRQLGINQNDSGRGPPSHEVVGWVRTGYLTTFATTPGEANCSNWEDGSASYSGTLARLPKDWEDGAASDMGVWDVNATLCNSPLSVWCVADVVGYRIYLSIVMK